MKIQTRAQVKSLTLRAAVEGSPFIGVLEGYAAVFNSDSQPFVEEGKPWVERIAPGAFKRTLIEQPDVRALWAHDAAQVIGRAPDTLKVSEDDHGLKVELSLIDTSINRDALASVRGGLVDAMSFGFIARAAEWTGGTLQDIRTLLDVELVEVSVVAWPAYEAASIGARSAGAGEDIQRERAKAFQAVIPDSPKTESVTVRLWAQRLRVT